MPTTAPAVPAFAAPMIKVPFSTNIESYGYHPESMTLRIAYLGGTAYEYFGVPPEVASALATSRSKGSYIHQNIKGKYKSSQVGGAPKPAAADFTDEPRPPIALVPVVSQQVKAIGYDAATKILAVQFNHGVGAIYHYPGVEPETHQAFMAAESIGTFFGKHIKSLAFKKYRPEQEAATA